MTTKELRELDAWIAEHIMRFKPSRHKFPQRLWVGVGWNHEPFEPTTDSTAAMEVLKRCVECGKIKGQFNIVIYRPESNGPWACGMKAAFGHQNVGTELAETLELAICLFAKKLFRKQHDKTQ